MKTKANKIILKQSVIIINTIQLVKDMELMKIMAINWIYKRDLTIKKENIRIKRELIKYHKKKSRKFNKLLIKIRWLPIILMKI